MSRPDLSRLVASADFPIPHPGHSPAMDLAIALDILRIVGERLADGEPIPRDSAAALMVVLSFGIDRLEPVLGYLQSDMVPTQREAYLAARRAWVLDNAGRQS